MYWRSKKLSVLILAAFLMSVFTGLGRTPANAATTPSDVYGSWAYAQISSLLNQGTISGYPDGTFKPNTTMTRAEFMSMVNRAFEYNATAAISYSDVKINDWFYTDVAKARAGGYISGYPDGTMRPNQVIQRQEAAVILSQAAKITNTYGVLPFTDAASIPTWSWLSISSMVKSGLISGYPDGSFKPTASITRAEAAAMIFNAMHNQSNKVTGVSLSDSTLELDKGDTYILEATISPGNAANKNVTWSSSKTSVATVSSTGKVTAKAKGTATITVITEDGGFTDTCKVYVDTSAGYDDFELSDNSIDMDTNDEVTVKAYLPDGVDMEDITRVSWDADDDDIADITDYDEHTSYITFTVESYDEEDDTTITIALKTDDETYKADLDVSVGSGNSGSDDFDFSDNSIHMDTNDEVTVKAYLPDGVDEGDVDDVNWNSDHDGIADITDYDEHSSYITLTVESYDNEGNTTISVTIDADGDTYTAYLDVIVGEGESDNDFTLSDDNIDMETDQDAVIYAYLPDDIEMDNIIDIYWDSDDPDIADIIDYDDTSSGGSIAFSVVSYNEGDTTITITIETTEGDYDLDLDVDVNDGDSSEGDLFLDDDSITIDRYDYEYVYAYLDDADGDIDYPVDYDVIDGSSSGVTVSFSNKDDDSFRIKVYGEKSGDYTIRFYVTTDEDEDYRVDLDVSVD